MTLWRLPQASSTKRDLLTRARSGDADAVRQLLTPHEALVSRLCLAVLGNRADAEDAAQETFLAAVRALPKFRGDAEISTWLVRIARNVCTKRRPSNVSLTDAEIPVAGPEEGAVTRSIVRDALAMLTETQRACLVLQAVEGWSVKEISASLRVNEKKVENELYRARKALARWEEETDGRPLDR
jgi:RNA polymerase sigma-70 factor (ECF subfamily)